VIVSFWLVCRSTGQEEFLDITRPQIYTYD
jgi:hypothetical protein